MHVVPKVARRSLPSLHDTPLWQTSRSFLLGHLAPATLSNKDTAACPTAGRNAGKGNDILSSRTYTSDFNHMTRREPPEPRGLPLVGTMFSLIMAGGGKKLHEYVDKRHRQLGPIYRESIGPVRAIFVNSPNEFRRIFRLEGTMPRHFLPESWLLYNEIRQQRRGLLFMDGEEWLYYRRILNKLMLMPNSVDLMCAPCQQVAESLTEKWRIESRDGATIRDMKNQLYQWSIEVMLAILMGSRWPDCKQQMASRYEHLALMLHQVFEQSVVLSMMPAKLAMQLRLPIWKKFVTTADTILDMVRVMVPELLQLGGDGLLSLMVNDGIRGNDAIKIIADFIIAAGDTSATSMQWALLLLSGRPELQDQLFDGIKDLSPEETMQHPLLKNILRETLRMYPVAPFLTRYLAADNLIGDYFVTKEDLLILSIWSSGHNAEHFPQPEEFQPERWIRIESGGYQGVNHPYGMLPFALGARSCIGRKLAETQIYLTLAELNKNFRIDCKNRDRIQMILNLVAVPSEPIILKLTKSLMQFETQPIVQ
ncbi:cytochrome P450 315a1, mitochondrial isoform X2 [Harpegnathos saltator]|uniref:cytochrome P450 315a1, mitochondrial isoform X2 n=1 Tax=Harpegnathos saltator TaxID=610380 RepID=UPI00058D7528|nr:cytochrome P450 315a1, mitochondrial isoform X2 [Harpegnathos saltator]